MLKKTFYFLWALSIVFALFIVVGGKIKKIGYRFILKEYNGKIYTYKQAEGKFYDGDLYNISKLIRYRDHITVFPWVYKTRVADAHIFCMGDSFLNGTLDSLLFAEELQKKLDQPVHNIPRFLSVDELGKYLSKAPGGQKYMVYEISENGLPHRFLPDNRMNNQTEKELSGVFKRLFDNSDINFFYYNNFIISPIDIFKHNFMFNMFRIIHPGIGAYSLSPPFLFYKKAVSFIHRKKPDVLVQQIADQMSQISHTLQNQYNVHVVYLIVPMKLTIYGKYAKPRAYAYDHFIPRVHRQLDSLDTPYISAYQIYRAYQALHPDDFLYYKGDFHYNALGKKLLVDQVARYIKSLEHP